jgi:2-hydroxychromene-2-carboxylate isomerase
MSRQLDLFFFIGSTYTYLTVSRVQDAASRESISIRWRPGKTSQDEVHVAGP